MKIRAGLAALSLLVTTRAHAQPDLPPPPPPPLAQEPAAAPPPRTAPSLATPPPAARSATAPSQQPPPAPPVYRPRHRREVVAVYEEYDPPRPVAITWNPLALVGGRLSGNVEVLLAPHHALLVSPSALVLQADRGGRYNAESQGLGFASRSGGGFGLELGYHYWWRWSRDLRGPFLGPSLLLGSTTNATAGPDPASAQTYWGAALDAGWQAVLAGGFTLGAGVGLGLVHLGGASAIFPRLLLQVGWSI